MIILEPITGVLTFINLNALLTGPPSATEHQGTVTNAAAPAKVETKNSTQTTKHNIVCYGGPPPPSPLLPLVTDEISTYKTGG